MSENYLVEMAKRRGHRAVGKRNCRAMSGGRERGIVTMARHESSEGSAEMRLQRPHGPNHTCS